MALADSTDAAVVGVLSLANPRRQKQPTQFSCFRCLPTRRMKSMALPGKALWLGFMLWQKEASSIDDEGITSRFHARRTGL